MTSAGLMHKTGSSGLVHWDDPAGWDGEGDGKGVQDEEHMYTPMFIAELFSIARTWKQLRNASKHFLDVHQQMNG